MYLHQTQLFQGTNISTKHIVIKAYPENHTIELEGTKSTYVGVILEGSVQVLTYTSGGTPILVSTLTEGMEFGDALIYADKRNTYPGNIVTKEDTRIAVIPNDKVEELVTTNTQFLHNFLQILSNKIITSNRNSKLLAQDTIRDKILYFLAQEESKQKSYTIHLNMTKEELAQLLHVTRPSVSRELANMKREGILDYDRYTITLLS